MEPISYARYLDKVYGCFLGKTVSGTIGAPYEGVKMPMCLPFDDGMIHTMLPNDDLDLQVLWLDVAERKGPDFTAADLLERFVDFCDYSPGEYAVMRRNSHKGIAPPLSGKFGNDFYREGMGCPIRSEIWACLAAGNPALAADYASRDGCLDHSGESVEAERFFAALEALAFYMDDIPALIEAALAVVPADSKFRRLVNDTVSLCAEYGDMETVFRKLLFRYGHPDCTNMYQNMGITLASLLLGERDIIKTSMLALNCGFDTDCTCASAGSVIGILRGADELMRGYGLTDVRYVLSVRSERRSDSVFDLSEDIARLGVAFAPLVNPALTLTGAPDVRMTFAPLPPLDIRFDYDGDLPSCGFGETCAVTIRVANRTTRALRLAVRLSVPAPFVIDDPLDTLEVAANCEASYTIRASVPADAETLPERNLFTLTLTDGNLTQTAAFGISGAAAYKVVGPFWRTEPVADTESLLAHHGYAHLMASSVVEGTDTDRVRHFHLNFFPDTETAFVDDLTLFAPFGSEGGVPAEIFTRNLPTDAFELNDLFGFQGPCVTYLAREIVSPEDMTVYIQLGHTSPYTLRLNDEIVSRRDNCDTWVSENVHVENVRLRKGRNRLVFRVTRVNADAKYNLTFSYGATCAEQLYCLGSVNPMYFNTDK